MHVITAHQPQFLPWAGFWAKADLCTHLILFSAVQYDKGQVTNRVKIEDEWVTVPVHAGIDKTIKDVCYEQRAIRKVVATIEQRLMNKHIPFRDRLVPVMECLVQASTAHDSLALLNTELIRSIAGVLGLNFKFTIDNDPMIGETKTARLHDMLKRNMSAEERNYDTRHVNTGSWFLSGGGGREYLESMPGLRTMYVEGNWPDCSVLQLIAKHEFPMNTIRGAVHIRPQV